MIILPGYIYSNGVSESLVGIALAMGSLAGVVGAFLYTRVRQCIGKRPWPYNLLLSQGQAVVVTVVGQRDNKR